MGLFDRLFSKKIEKQESPIAGTSMAKDPVCGMEVNKEKAPAVFLYLGQALYFCSPSCERLFRGNPDKYVKAERYEMGRHSGGRRIVI